VERMLLGSVADKVIRAAEQAVLVVPTHREAR
jgi:nucleotide-binding universal stress UspA family protein